MGTFGAVNTASDVKDFPTTYARGVVAQARRTTTYALTTSLVDIGLDATDVETDASIIDHLAGTNDRIQVLRAGTYEISWYADVVVANGITSVDTKVKGRVTLNDVAAAMAGSESETGNHYSGSAAFSEDYAVGRTFYATLAANDFVTLQLQRSAGGTPSTHNAKVGVSMSVLLVRET